MFEINSNTELNVSVFSSIPVGKTIRRFYRDISFTTNPAERIKTIVSIERDASLFEESWRIESSDYCLRIYASDELGVIYVLNYISSGTLGIKPLWYWCNQTFEKKDSHIFSHDYAESEHNAIRFRGWFINDEVLFLGLEPDGLGSEQWERRLSLKIKFSVRMLCDKEATISLYALSIPYLYSVTSASERLFRDSCRYGFIAMLYEIESISLSFPSIFSIIELRRSDSYA